MQHARLASKTTASGPQTDSMWHKAKPHTPKRTSRKVKWLAFGRGQG
jgi:hypothetical protein